MESIKLHHETRLVDPKALIPHEKNAAVHPPEQVESLAASFKKFGFIGSVIVGSDNKILAGHGRVLAALQADMKEIPITDVSHLSEVEQDAFMIVDNKSSEQKEWDHELLDSEISRLSDLKFDFSDFGLDDLITEFENGPRDGEHSEPKHKVPEDERWDSDEDEDGNSRESEYDKITEPTEPDEKSFDAQSVELKECKCPRCNHEFRMVG